MAAPRKSTSLTPSPSPSPAGSSSVPPSVSRSVPPSVSRSVPPTVSRSVPPAEGAGCAPARDRYHHGHLAAALVDEALRQIESGPTRDVSLRACAKALGVDVAAVYRHYASKEALLRAVADHGAGELVRLIDRATARLPARTSDQVFVAIGRAYVSFATDRPRLYDAVFGAPTREGRAAPPDGPASPPAAPRSAWTMLGECLDRMVDDGHLDPRARVGADVVAWSAVHGLATLLNQGLVVARGAARDALVEQLCQTVLAGLRRRSDDAGGVDRPPARSRGR